MKKFLSIDQGTTSSRSIIFDSDLKLVKDSQKEYDLEYGSDSLCLQKKSLEGLDSFVIVDDLLATGGTAKCVEKILTQENKKILGLSVVVELKELCGKNLLNFPVKSEIVF